MLRVSSQSQISVPRFVWCPGVAFIVQKAHLANWAVADGYESDSSVRGTRDGLRHSYQRTKIRRMSIGVWKGFKQASWFEALMSVAGVIRRLILNYIWIWSGSAGGTPSGRPETAPYAPGYADGKDGLERWWLAKN